MPNQSPKYRLSLKLADKTYTKIAPSIVEALDKLIPEHVSKSKAVITVSYQKRKATVLLWPLQVKRLFINKISKELFQKRMLGALK